MQTNVFGEGMLVELEFGLETFGDVTRDASGQRTSHAQVLRDVVAEAELADQLGVNIFGVGEHHRDDFAISAPDTVLAAIAGRTERIRVGSAVTVLSSDDPIRVFQRFSTINAISNGRAEVILGRGSFTESFALFGYELSDYEALFEQKLEIFAQLVQSGEVTWQGSIRPPLHEQTVYPPIEHGRLRTLIGVGGSPQSVLRAANYGFPLVLAIIGGSAERFAPFANLYRHTLAQAGKAQLPIAVHSPGHIAETDEQARNECFPDGPRPLVGLAANVAGAARSAAPSSSRRPHRMVPSMSARPKRWRRRSRGAWWPLGHPDSI